MSVFEDPTQLRGWARALVVSLSITTVPTPEVIVSRALLWLDGQGIVADPRACAALLEAITPTLAFEVEKGLGAALRQAFRASLDGFASAAGEGDPVALLTARTELHVALGELFDRAQRGSPTAIVANALMFALERRATEAPDPAAVATLAAVATRIVGDVQLTTDDALDLVEELDRAGWGTQPLALDRLADAPWLDSDAHGAS